MEKEMPWQHSTKTKAFRVLILSLIRYTGNIIRSNRCGEKFVMEKVQPRTLGNSKFAIHSELSHAYYLFLGVCLQVIVS